MEGQNPAPRETMGNRCLLVFAGESSFQGFLGGAGFFPSTVWAMMLVGARCRTPFRPGFLSPRAPRLPEDLPDGGGHPRHLRVDASRRPGVEPPRCVRAAASWKLRLPHGHEYCLETVSGGLLVFQLIGCNHALICICAPLFHFQTIPLLLHLKT